MGESPRAYESSPTDFSTLLKRTDRLPFTISSDQEALSVISPFLGWNSQFTGKTQKISPGNSSKSVIPPDLADSGIELILEITLLHWAQQWEKTLTLNNALPTLATYETQEPLLNWVESKTTQPEATRVFSLLKVFLELTMYPQPDSVSLEGYRDFSGYLFETYPDWTDSESSWLRVAEQEGTPSIIRRLKSYWRPEVTNKAIFLPEQEPKIHAFIGHFLHKQVIPLFKTHLKISLYSLQTKSERRAWKAWQQIQERTAQLKEREGLTRLCGTWQWLMHNHQNHGDHRTLMTYPPPSQYDRMEPKPSKILVQGDTVYIRWEFPRGIIQEESLLFSEKDRMLSGTFVNNMGPNGNITARRMAPCSKE